MPGEGFKISNAYVVVSPKDGDFQVGLRAIVEEAAAGVDASVGVRLSKAAPEELRADLDAALFLVTDGLNADVGMGLHNDAVEELDADVKAGVKLVEENNKVKVQVDPKSAQAAGSQASALILGGIAAAVTAGPGLILAATAAAVLGAGVLITHSNADLAGSYKKLGMDASDAITKATAPLVPQINASLTVLDQGIAKVGPELKDLFAAVAPEATQLTAGLVSLATNALPGITTGLRAIQPYTHTIADDFGKLGTGVSDFFAGLATGAAGGTTGLDALITTAEHLLGDIGQIAGSLANGLGPALHDISVVAIPVAGALTSVIKAFPPVDIRVAADATAALLPAYKLARLAGLL